MKKRQKIDRLFQEKLSDFETVPPEIAWENIKIKLEKKKKRRVIPIWWRLSGVAASLLLGLWISYTLVVDTNSNEMKQQEIIQSSKETLKLKNAPTDNQLEEKQIVGIKDSSINTKRVIEPKNPSTLINSNNRVASFSSSTDKKNADNLIRKNHTPTLDETAIVSSTDEKNDSQINTMHNATATKVADKKRIEKYNETNSKTSDLMEKNEKPFTDFNVSTKSSKLVVSDTSSHTLPNVEDIKKTNEVATTENNELDKLLKEKEEKTSKKEKINRWQINSTVAPVYYNSLTDGSPLDAQFESNQKEYNTSQSFGVGINYALNKKIKVRTGINTVAVNYDTNDVQLNPTFTGGLNISIQGTPINIHNVGFYGTKNPSPTGIINQKMGYVEVPVELSYQVVNKRFGIELIGGVSTLFLTQNVITMKIEQEKINLGSANNLNTIHYSGNLGLGLKYGIMKQLEFRVEPVVKYQFNPFSSTNTNSKTYIFGLYSGIGFNF